MIGFYGYMQQCETCANRDCNSLGYYCMVLDEKHDTGNGVCSSYDGESEGKNETENSISNGFY